MKYTGTNVHRVQVICLTSFKSVHKASDRGRVVKTVRGREEEKKKEDNLLNDRRRRAAIIIIRTSVYRAAEDVSKTAKKK